MANKERKERRAETRQWLNGEIGVVAKWTRVIPEGPRRKVRDCLIWATTPRKDRWRPPRPFRPGRYPRGINVYGFFREENGLGQGVRMYARGLEAAGVPHRCLHTDFLEWLPQNEHSFDSQLKKRPRYGVNLIHINPDQWIDACICFPQRCLDGHYNIGVWLWELTRIPDHWVKCLENVDELWVPSEFIAEAVRRDTEKPVHVFPYGVETPTDGAGRADFGLEERDFLVLAMFDSNSYAKRKNPMGAVEAFIRAFAGTEDARLVLKVNNPHAEDVEMLEKRLREAGVHYTLIRERMPKGRLNALIACCDVFLSLHRSEGFGFPVAEAMMLGTAVVATNWSATAEFMNPEVCCPVGYTLIPVGNDYQFPREGQEWAEPDLGEAAACLRELYENPEKRERMARAGQAYIREALSLEKCGLGMKKRLEEICPRFLARRP